MNPHHPRTRKLIVESLLAAVVTVPVSVFLSLNPVDDAGINLVARIGTYLIYGGLYLRWLEHAVVHVGDEWGVSWFWRSFLTLYPAYAVYLLVVRHTTDEGGS
jgi:hypothetical protein